MFAAQIVRRFMEINGLGVTIDGDDLAISLPKGFDFTPEQRETLMELKPELYELVRLEVC